MTNIKEPMGTECKMGSTMQMYTMMMCGMVDGGVRFLSGIPDFLYRKVQA